MAFKTKTDFSDVTRKFNKIADKLGDLKEPFNTIGDDIIEYVGEKNFDAEGSKLGSRWSPLAASTLQSRARGYGHYAQSPKATNKILIWTGKLQEGFTKSVTAIQLKIENTVGYFKYAAQKRPMLGINSDILKIIEDNVNKFLIKITK